MDNKEQRRELAYLEFVHDQLLTELQMIDQLLREVGFCGGVQSVKEAAAELLFDENFNES